MLSFFYFEGAAFIPISPPLDLRLGVYIIVPIFYQGNHIYLRLKNIMVWDIYTSP